MTRLEFYFTQSILQQCDEEGFEKRRYVID